MILQKYCLLVDDVHSYSNPNGGGKRKGRRQTYPPPFPNGKGAGRLMAVTDFQDNVSFEDGLSFSPLGETGEGFCRDLSPIVVIFRLVELPLS